jgi:D-alanyl-lipoteichoic acid acyltransferase DltB (MBOAT superfamily)
VLFNSYVFLFLFLPVTALGFAALGRLSHRLTLGWLTLCSLFFYGFWNPPYLLLLGLSVGVNFGCGWCLSALHRTRWSHLLLALGLTFNLALLGYYKYAGFFLRTVNDVTGTALTVPEIVLPLGISFFTFQQMAYLVDAWKGLTREFRLIDYTLFVTFFPQLIAGPIVHHKELLDQFAAQKRLRFRADDVAVGIVVFVLGLFKKVVLADNVSGYANEVFGATASGVVPVVGDAWIGVLAYTFQLYFDFSGYSDMAVGLGRLFGIAIPVNFDSPYRATSVVDFWRRWHMTLSRFLRDYLYIPLGGSRRGPFRRYVNLLLTMVLGGLWHGAGWTFLLWGGLHGLYLCVNNAWSSVCRRAGWEWTQRRWWRVVATGLTFLAVIAGWVLFRAADTSSALTLLAAMVGVGSSGAVPLVHDADEAALFLLGLAGIVWACPNTQEFAGLITAEHEPQQSPLTAVERRPWIAWRPSFVTGVAVSVVFVFTVTTMTKVREFLYFQF